MLTCSVPIHGILHTYSWNKLPNCADEPTLLLPNLRNNSVLLWVMLPNSNSTARNETTPDLLLRPEPISQHNQAFYWKSTPLQEDAYSFLTSANTTTFTTRSWNCSLPPVPPTPSTKPASRWITPTKAKANRFPRKGLAAGLASKISTSCLSAWGAFKAKSGSTATCL